ncbi:techylectin-5B-like [Amphibalanus amphitrite]|uniref:techylectin-5B-like n=1 Tax=Amphibalanus amphitrite TaxID=1232801 RepID=UPI001C90863D|nr:techylectin-5B-like [Amphibalanus amphitrite]
MGLPLRPPVAVCVLLLLVCAAGSAADMTSGLTSETNGTSQQDSIARDCSDLPRGTTSGVYMIMVDLQTPTPAYCDMDDGEGWTVFQRRADITPRQDFFQDWEAYKWGLGSLEGEFWWGLHYLWQLTSQNRIYELRVDLWDWDEQTRYATYQKFTIASEADGYRLDFVNSSYAGDAGDSLSYHNGMKFSTFDRDNDATSGGCSSYNNGAWWYKNCQYSNLNGLYIPGSTDTKRSVRWAHWRDQYSLNATTMKIRPTNTL